MRVGLFIPCYINQLYPDVARATLSLLEKAGCNVVYPLGQTCCGQPMANAGFASYTGGCNRNFIGNFSGFDHIVVPSGSCALHIREHLHDQDEALAAAIRGRVFELTEFLTDVLHYAVQARFPHRVGLHISCHGQRMLGLASMSERMEPSFSKAEALLQQVEGLQLLLPERRDECCGFGGTFCVTEEAVSVAMGSDREEQHERNQVDFITGGDVSCLMHLEGILKRRNSPVRIVHIAEILDAE
ncbi:(Fe-S)-binding protein [Flaviaesturariibacter flavus]|uniref:(Fe-S)-binding protein n=1 Tax=Flaviaesturariibacter flavus TaxID=2502780 RepID=A0A4R1BQM0_9BACT|nr:(Fe-S)-binding protein [Flaviaesturariibacter flavus]TCJ19587.1 (Fe-S)-binding protein [Flaviaesturariibacter flavus]